ncbi:hypothetical protein FB451DRAFT_1560763 [Mycena latifolia]|nr:hypothetical protein FB451DRAFT_1560763 [Mycena latifolia]
MHMRTSRTILATATFAGTLRCPCLRNASSRSSSCTRRPPKLANNAHPDDAGAFLSCPRHVRPACRTCTTRTGAGTAYITGSTASADGYTARRAALLLRAACVRAAQRTIARLSLDLRRHLYRLRAALARQEIAREYAHQEPSVPGEAGGGRGGLALEGACVRLELVEEERLASHTADHLGRRCQQRHIRAHPLQALPQMQHEQQHQDVPAPFLVGLRARACISGDTIAITITSSRTRLRLSLASTARV